ncbi:MAG: phosphotransferase, partial [Streptosporangiales bacterium]|nr:phosphotransferase [Streptosporangiales bacterium]
MLTAADRDLAHREPDLPGIRLALDVEALADRLAHWLPAGDALVEGRVTYLRYKPRTSLVAGLALRTTSGHRQAFVKAYGPGSAPKLDKLRSVGAHDRIGLGTFVDDGLRLAVVDATSDRRLPALRRMLAKAERCVEPLRYKPERRWVGVVGRQTSDPCLVKIHQPGFARSFARRHAALERAGLPVPELRRAQPATGLMTYEWFEGEHVEDVDAPGLLTEVGALLARLHAVPVTAEPAATPVSRAAELADAVRAIAAAVPGAARAAGESARSARAALA